MGGIPTLIKELKKAGLDGITLTVNSLKFFEYNKMTGGNKTQFNLMMNALREISNVFKEKTTLNIVVTIINYKSIKKILTLSKKKGVKVKLLELTNGKLLRKIYIPFPKIAKKFKGGNIKYVNSCCPSNNCKLCKKLYPVVRLSPDGKINNCIMNEEAEVNIFKSIKNRDKEYIKKALLYKLTES